MNQEIIKALEQLGGSGLINEIFKITNIGKTILADNLNTMYKRGEINKTFTNLGKYRGSTIGLMTKYQYVYSLK